METFWLLFLIMPRTLEQGGFLLDLSPPMGIYKEQAACDKAGTQLEKVLSYKYDCRKATEAVLGFYARRCLSDDEKLRQRLIETGRCEK